MHAVRMQLRKNGFFKNILFTKGYSVQDPDSVPSYLGSVWVQGFLPGFASRLLKKNNL